MGQDRRAGGLVAVALGALGLACGAPAGGSAATAGAELRDAAGRVVGTVLLAEGGAGVRVSVNADGIAPGEHGVHVHAVGRCDPDGAGAFATAGGHFNPDGRSHGLDNPAGPHAGDLPNLTVGADGRGTLTTVSDRFTLAVGERSLFDADGAAIVVHAGRDDMRTDPAGDAGARIACGVLVRR